MDEQDEDGWISAVRAAQKAEKVFYEELAKNDWEESCFPIRIEICNSLDEGSRRGNKTFVINHIPEENTIVSEELVYEP